MHKFHLIEKLFTCLFDYQIGRTNAEINKIFASNLSNPEYRKSLISELNSAFADPDISWLSWFSEYCAEDFEDEERARAYAKELLYDPAMAAELESSKST